MGPVEIEKMKAEKATYARNPKLPYFEEAKDKMDSYLARFEKYAIVNKWDQSLWSTYLSALLKGRALEIYDSMAVSDAADYAKLKDALLKNFDMTERGFTYVIQKVMQYVVYLCVFLSDRGNVFNF